MADRVLLVDDEPNVLDGYRRGLRRDFDLELATGPEQGLEAIQIAGPFAVVVSDFQMPRMNDIQFLGEVARRAPETVRIMLTGQADLRVAAAAVNEGNVFRFLTKPCQADELAASLNAGIEQNRLIRAERELIEGTLKKTVTLLSEVIGLIDPDTEQHNARLTEIVNNLAAEFPAPSRWKLELAARLSQVGLLTLPTDLRRKIQTGETLSEREAEAASRRHEAAFGLIQDIPRLGEVAAMIRYQGSPPAPPPAEIDRLEGEELVAAGAHALNLAAGYQAALIGTGSSEGAANVVVGGEPPIGFRSRLMGRLLGKSERRLLTRVESVGVSKLQPDMVVNEDVRALNGTLLLGKGHRVTAPMIQRLERIRETAGVVEPFEVTITVESA